MTTEIRAAWSPGEIRVAVLVDAALADYAIWRPGAPDGVGDIHRGRVIASVPAMAGAFVALADHEGFLPDSEGAKGLTAGTILTVRVTRAPQGGKGPRLTARDVPPEDGPPGLRHRGQDPLRALIIRHTDAPILADDPALMATLRGDFAGRVSLVTTAFGDALDAEVDALSDAEITTASGARLSVHPTPALVAIDVDGGGALSGLDRATHRHRTLNLGVMADLALQIRLRNLSGAILTDFAGLKAKQRASLAPALTAALANDPLRPRLLGFTALGFAEIARPRVRPPLHEVLSGPLAAGLVALRALSRANRAEPGRRLGLRAAPAVIAALEADPVALADLARITGRRLNSRADPGLGPGRWRIEEDHG